jgi:hypothetical protein
MFWSSPGYCLGCFISYLSVLYDLRPEIATIGQTTEHPLDYPLVGLAHLDNPRVHLDGQQGIKTFNVIKDNSVSVLLIWIELRNPKTRMLGVSNMYSDWCERL